MIGKTILHYKIIDKLGQGGMGVVYKAEDNKLKRDVAIKFLPRQIASQKEEKERFKVEARAAAALNHPNIATIYAIEEADDEAFIVMEFIDGRELKDKIAGGPVKINESLDIAKKIADGLRAAHSKGIVHRDIKSSNIMITSDGQIKIMDFGLAKITGSGLMTKVGTTMGTAAYMSPEQATGEKVDERTDIWSLGVIFYELLTGELPFKAEYEAAWNYVILNKDPLKPSELDRKIPANVDSLVLKMLEKDRGKRYSSADEIIKDLEKIGEGSNAEQDANIKAIAVLPFNNISAEKESDYFSDGLTEELILNLSRLKDMRVVSRTTSMQYKGTSKGIKDIGRDLGVRYIIEGSVRKFEDNLRITAQLIDVEKDAQLWAESYKGKLADVFDIQEKVSQQIVDALMVKLSPTEKVALSKRPTVNAEAFDYNLRARNYLYRYSKNNIQFAIQFFEKAISLDLRYAEAYAGLAEAYAVRYAYFERKDTWLDKAIELSLKAIMYDSSLSEAYAALALAYFYKSSFEEALTAVQKAIDLDQNNFFGYWILGRIYFTTDKDKDALDPLKKAIEINPEFYTAYGDLRLVTERLGDKKQCDEINNKSIQFYPKYLEQNPDDSRARMFYAQVLVLNEKIDQAKKETSTALELSPNDSILLYNAACVYSVIDEKELAIKTLQNAVAGGFEHYDWIKRDPDLENIRKETEFNELIKGK
ncbi:MAG: protein kinase [Ignavibacteriaceae bacterium]|jgi:serine/threonine protein kinase/Flp pilus assembly protein TadD